MVTKPRKSKARSQAGNVDLEKLRARLQGAWYEGGQVVDSVWHESAVAALSWVASHLSRISGLRQAFKDTPVEAALDAVLGTLRAEARTPVSHDKANCAKPATQADRAAAQRERVTRPRDGLSLFRVPPLPDRSYPGIGP